MKVQWQVIKNAIAIAESGRNGEIRYVGKVEASDASMRRIIQRVPISPMNLGGASSPPPGMKAGL
jgi:hypothetical protein